MSEAFKEMLLVDDNPGDILLLQTMLEEAFAKDLVIQTAGTVGEAAQILRGKVVPIIILDLSLPDSWGSQTYRRIRAEAPDSVIVILSGTNDDRIALELVREGAQDYLVKGLFNTEILRRVIQYAWERSLTEKELVERRAWWKALIQAIPDAVLISDQHNKIRFANPAAAGLLKASLDQLQALEVQDINPPEVRELVLKDLEILGQSDLPYEKVPLRQMPLVGLDGSVQPAEIVRSMFKSGSERLFVTVARDISERKKLEEQLLQTQKMDALGHMTAGIAHDFNNLLAVIVGNLDILARISQSQPVIAKRVETAMGAALRGADLTKRLLAFSRAQELMPHRLVLGKVISNFLDMAARTIGPDIKVETSIAKDLPDIFVDQGELENVLLNLTVNAKDAMPHGGLLLFTCANMHLTEQDADVRFGELAAGDYVQLTVTDTGTGMPREVIEQAFEPFFTTKERGKGTGLGLSMVYGFAKQSGGTVKIYSEVGEGTSIRLIFPATEGLSVKSSSASSVSHHVALPEARALVVDDEPDLLEVACLYLQELGYEVTSASNGPEALQKFKEKKFTVLITDVLMPGGMNGSDLARKVKEVDPELKVIFTSGFPAQALADKDVLLDSVIISKPYIRSDLDKALAQVFGLVSD